jgi:hypothetical protein
MTKLFTGETMTCIMCGKVEKSDPNENKNWRAVELDGIPYYACTDHFPPDETGSSKDFEKAYTAVISKAAALHRRRK